MSRPVASGPHSAILEVRDLAKHFGGVRAVDGVSCRVPEGMIYAVIGPNGAGKTTFFNCLNGIEKPTSGSILFDGADITGLAPHRVASLGVARTWQTIQLFEHMTALENVMVGLHSRTRAGMLASMLRLPRHWRTERQARSEALARLDQLGIAELAGQHPGALPFLKQRRIELARALASEPRLLLLDEPAAGLNSRETAELGELIHSIRESGVTVVLVEHDMSLVMEISDRVFVLDHGTPVMEGTPREVQEDPRVIAVYLGEDDETEPEEAHAF